MAQLVLVVNPKTTPVPWGPLALSYFAASIDKTSISTKFDQDATATTLIAGQKIFDDSLEIIDAIAGAAGIHGEASQVIPYLSYVSYSLTSSD